jgi:hypothetical protein
MPLLQTLKNALDEDRKQEPWRYVSLDAPIIFIENVAQMLGCSIDTVRRIPRYQLPARRGASKRLLYLRADVVKYVENLPTDDAGAANDIQQVAQLTRKPKTESSEFYFLEHKTALQNRR